MTDGTDDNYMAAEVCPHVPAGSPVHPGVLLAAERSFCLWLHPFIIHGGRWELWFVPLILNLKPKWSSVFSQKLL